MKSSDKNAVLESLQAACDAVQAEADPLYAAIREYKDKGTPEKIIARLKALGWTGVMDGMKGCRYFPEKHHWDERVHGLSAAAANHPGASWKIVAHPLKWKVSQIADEDIASATLLLGEMKNRLECLKAQLQFYNLIDGDADVAGDHAWNVFYLWVEHVEDDYFATGHKEQGAMHEADYFEILHEAVAKLRKKVEQEFPIVPDDVDPSALTNARHGGMAKWRLTI